MTPIYFNFMFFFIKVIFISVYRIIITDFIRICVSSNEVCLSDSHGLSNLKCGLPLNGHWSFLRRLAPFFESVMSQSD